MTQQHPSENRPRAVDSDRPASHLIEKGWTVLDAVERPVGNVSDVDTSRNVLQVDGRAQGLETYEVPLSMVEKTGSNVVHLSRALDPASSETTPRFQDAPVPAATPSTTTRARARARTEPTMSTAPTTATTTTSSSARPERATTDPVGEATMSQFTPPYAVSGAHDSASAWDDRSEDGWSMSKLVTGGLALSGLAAAAYVMRRRMRRKTPYERFIDTASMYSGVASEFARNRHPAWWASLAAAALPLAYYAWPTSKPTYTQQARSQADDLTGMLSSYLGDLTGQMPSVRNFEMPTWKSLGRGESWDWSPRPDLAGTAGALAAGALAIYLIRRATSKSAGQTRIADVMTRRPRVIQPDATIADAAAIMRQMDVGALPVCDGTRLIGMLTDRDITVRSTADGRDPHLTPVRDVMSPGVAWATEDDLVDEAARIMREHRIRRLPIVDERHSLVGVVSLGDLAVDVANDDLSGDTLEQISEKSPESRNWQ